MPISTDLQSYLENCKSQGLPFSAMKDLLAQAGWSSDSISEAEAWYTGHPSVIPDVNSVVKNPKRTPKSFKAFLIIGLLLILGLITTGSVSAYLLANDKLPLSITKAVYALPFIPKSPQVILGLTTSAQNSVTKNSYNLSVAASSQDPTLIAALGRGNLDLNLTGYANYRDINNPEVKSTLEVNKDLIVNIISRDQQVYLKINKVPVFASAGLAIFGIKPEDLNPLLEKNWIKIDTSTLDTPARKVLDSQITTTTIPTPSAREKVYEQLALRILNEDIAPELKLTKSTLDTNNVYKIEFKPSSELIDKIYEKIKTELQKDSPNNNLLNNENKISENLKNLSITAYIDQNSYYLLRLDTSVDISFPSTDVVGTKTLTEFKIVSVLTLSDFGKDVPVEVPENTIPAEEFMNQVFNLSTINSQTPPVNPLGI